MPIDPSITFYTESTNKEIIEREKKLQLTLLNCHL